MTYFKKVNLRLREDDSFSRHNVLSKYFQKNEVISFNETCPPKGARGLKFWYHYHRFFFSSPMRSVQEVSATKKGRRRREIPLSCSPQKMPLLLLPPYMEKEKKLQQFFLIFLFRQKKPSFSYPPTTPCRFPSYTRELSCFQIYCCRRKRRGKRERRVPAPFPPAHAKVDWQSRLTPTRKATWGFQQLLFF